MSAIPGLCVYTQFNGPPKKRRRRIFMNISSISLPFCMQIENVKFRKILFACARAMSFHFAYELRFMKLRKLVLHAERKGEKEGKLYHHRIRISHSFRMHFIRGDSNDGKRFILLLCTCKKCYV